MNTIDKILGMPVGEVNAAIAREGERLHALGEATENVEQLEAIERDLERLVVAAKRIVGAVEMGGQV